MDYLRPVRERYAELRPDEAALEAALERGAEQARALAAATMVDVRAAMGVGAPAELAAPLRLATARASGPAAATAAPASATTAGRPPVNGSPPARPPRPGRGPRPVAGRRLPVARAGAAAPRPGRRGIGRNRLLEAPACTPPPVLAHERQLELRAPRPPRPPRAARSARACRRRRPRPAARTASPPRAAR